MSLNDKSFTLTFDAFYFGNVNHSWVDGQWAEHEVNPPKKRLYSIELQCLCTFVRSYGNDMENNFTSLCFALYFLAETSFLLTVARCNLLNKGTRKKENTRERKTSNCKIRTYFFLCLDNLSSSDVASYVLFR